MSDAMNTEEEEAYRQAASLLESSRDLAPRVSSIPTLVSLRDIVREPPLEGEPHSILLTPNKGHHALFRALEDLEKLESEVVLEKDTLATKLTCTVMNAAEGDEGALQALQTLGRSIPRRVCQYPFRRNDIVWVCRTCQANETCVLCHSCYTQSNHDGHDVAFYHAQAGGCCDCGDPDAWDSAGFCPHHGPSARATEKGGLDGAIVDRVKGIVPATVDWLVSTIAANAEKAHQRAKPIRPEVRREESNDNESSDLDTASVTERLGVDGLEGHGLYLVLHADDIHTTSQLVEGLRDLYGGSSYFSDHLLGLLVRALHQYGQLVVWGTMEVVGVCSHTHVHCWLDGDKVASSRIGAVLLGKATCLARHGLVCSIMTRKELQFEQRAVAVLQWLSELAKSCDPLCQTVAESILPEEHLVPMLRSDFKLSAHITKAWHSLLLTLLAVPAFKSNLAATYCETYRFITSEYVSGLGVLERSGYTLSVQFLSRVTYVIGLVKGRDLLGKLGKSLLETLSVATTSSNRLNPNHFVLTHRRYSPCISDLKRVLNVKGMARLFASSAGSFLQDWIEALSLAQLMDGIVWRTMSQGHVEVEPRGWVGAFNASISLGSLFEQLLSWEDDDPSPIEPAQSPLAQNLQTCVELAFYIVTQGVAQWQNTEMASYVSKADSTSVAGEHCLCPVSLPLSTVAVKNGTPLAFGALPIAQTTPWSFHLPLHRFLAASLREVCRRPHDQSGMERLMQRLRTQVPETELDFVFQGMMEFPSLVLSRAAQIRAGLWGRNGGGMNDEVSNYAEPPFCRTLRDADILLLQFAVLGRRPHGEDMGCSLMVHLLLHRFGLFDFMGLAKGPSSNIQRYKEECAARLYDPEIMTLNPVEQIEGCDIVLPWTFTPAKDVPSLLVLLEEFLHLLIVLMTEIPSLPPKNKEDHTLQAKERLRREVVHRLASGPKTHSELSEVQHVLSQWDNLFLNDASGAAREKALAEVADQNTVKGKLSPYQWELRREGWNSYDPAFFHISLRSHQSIAENRPKPATASTPFGFEAKPFALSKQIPAHPYFQRLERDVAADGTVLAVAYRTLHVHCSNHNSEPGRDYSVLGSAEMAYHSDATSETALSRAVHLLTLGAFAWQHAKEDDRDWRSCGGGSRGSIFHDWSNDTAAPTARDWVAVALMSPPDELMDSEWYSKEESMLLLLHCLAVDGGMQSGFISQDCVLRSGAAWLCEFAAQNNEEANALIGSRTVSSMDSGAGELGMSDLERRKAAKARAMERMKAQAASFAANMKMDSQEMDEDTKPLSKNTSSMIGLLPIHPFHLAVINLPPYEVEQKIQSSTGSDRLLGLRDGGGKMALHFASVLDRPPTVHLLLDCGADINAQDNNGDTALGLAARQQCNNAVRALLERGADPNLPDVDDQTPLAGAADHGHFDIVSSLLDQESTVIDELAILAACRRGHVSIVRLMLDKGANINLRNEWGPTPLMTASMHGQVNIVRLLIEHNVDLVVKEPETGATAIDMAFMRNQHGVVSLLKDAMSQEMLDNILFKDLVLQGETASSPKGQCSGCCINLESTESYYQCVTCNFDRDFCVACVLDGEQVANQLCPNHVLVRVGMPLSPQSKGHRFEEFETMRLDERAVVNRWLEVNLSKSDRHGLYEVVQALSEAVSCGDLQLVLHILQRVGLASFTELVRCKIESGEIREPYNVLYNLESETKRAIPEKRRHLDFLCNWLLSRSQHPEDKLPPWLALIGLSQVYRPWLCQAVTLIYVTQFDILGGPSFSSTEMATLFQDKASGEPLLTTSVIGDLTVATLPSTELFCQNRMPEYSSCGKRDSTVGANEEGPSVKLFVSHAWRSQLHPDPDGADWLSLRDLVFEYITVSIWLYRSLEALGFSSHVITNNSFVVSAHFPISPMIRDIKQGFSGDTSCIRELDNAITDELAANLLEIVSFCLNQEHSNTADEQVLYLAVARRISFWIDFVCLPQSVTSRRSEDDQKWFQSSLQQMGSIQRSMHTVVVNTNEEYCERAWCVAEFINTNESFWLVSSSGFRPKDRMKASIDACLQAMVGTQATSALEVIERLGLGITNGVDADAVCRILWSRVGLYLQDGAPARLGPSAETTSLVGEALHPKASSPWLVAEGRAALVSSYLKALGQGSILDYDKGWRRWREDFAAGRSAQRSSETHFIHFLADSRVSFVTHDLLPSLLSLSLFVSTLGDPNASVRALIVSQHLNEDNNSHSVAFPTSKNVEYADAVVLHPQPRTFKKLNEHGLHTSGTHVKELDEHGGSQNSVEMPVQLPKSYNVIPNGTAVTFRMSQRLAAKGKICGFHSGMYTVVFDDLTTRQMKASDLIQIARVRLHGIQSKPRWNGKEGFIMGWNDTRKRYIVHVLDGINESFSCSPSKIVLPNGTVAQIRGLVSKTDLNGKFGTIIHWIQSANRYHVQLSKEQAVSVSADNVHV